MSMQKSISAYLLTYFLVSLLLSISIFARLLLVSTPVTNAEWFNLILYDLYYYVMPAIAATFLILMWCKQKSKRQQKNPKHSEVLLPVLAIALLSFNALLYGYLDLFPIPSPLKYAAFSALAPLMLCFYIKWRKPQNTYLDRKVAAALIIIIIIMPYASAFASFDHILSTVREINGNSGRIAYVSGYVLYTTMSIWQNNEYVTLHRAQNDFWKYLMLGVGGCGEMAIVSKQFFDRLGVESRIIAFPGEDHSFVEAKLNGTWMVADTGYYGSELLTREERGLKRIEEFGGLSYVIAYEDNMFVELTQYYVPTDTVIVRVTYGSEPLANAEILLKHIFLGRETRLPDQEHTFYSDGNGTVELHIGSMTYNEKAGSVEPYYWIYVNGLNTGHNVTSTGSGKAHYIEIDVLKLLK